MGRAHRPGPVAGPVRVWWSPAVSALVVVTAAVVLSACAGQEQSGPASARVATWVSGGGGGASIGTLRVDSANVSQALARHDAAAAVRTVCALLTTDAETAIGNLPTPDNLLTDDLNAAYTEAASAGDDCYAGSTAQLARSARERTRLGSLLNTAVSRITAVTGHTPSTSTTRPADTGDPFGG